MAEFTSLGKRKAVLGMIHLKPLPGTLLYEEGSFSQTLDLAVQSARALSDGGADGCLVQTVDRIYSVKDESDPARTAAMSLIVQAIVQATGDDFQVGVQIMRNALQASLAVAKVAGGSFIRAGAVVGMTLTAHGMVEANPLEVMEYRKRINAGGVKVIAEVDSMQFKWFGEAKPVAEVARSAKVRWRPMPCRWAVPMSTPRWRRLPRCAEACPDCPSFWPAIPTTRTRHGCWRLRTERLWAPAWSAAAGAGRSISSG